MQFEESRQSRMLMGSLDRGEELVAQVQRLAELQQIKAGALRGLGTLRDVELMRRNHTTGEWIDHVAAEGPFEIVQLTAHLASLGDNPAVRIEALLSAQGPAGPQLTFGQIRRATVVEFEFTVEAFDDLVAERRLDKGMLILAEVRNTTTSAPIRERKPVERIAEPKLGKAEPVVTHSPAVAPRQAPTVSPTPAPTRPTTPAPTPTAPVAQTAAKTESTDDDGPGMSWGDAFKAAQEIKTPAYREKPPVKRPPRVDDEDDDDEEDDHSLMEPGDILDHPKLGRCRIIKVEEDEFAHIRLERGAIRKLALEVCDIRHVGEEGGKNVFKVRIKR